MSKIPLFARFLKDERGATAIEYGLIAALIAVALVVGATAFGTEVTGLFSDVDGEMSVAFGSGSGST